MTRMLGISYVRRWLRNEAGASLIEYTVVVSLFLLIFFAILDFGRLGFNWVMTEKAMQRAARIATVRPPVTGCAANVPTQHVVSATGSYGTLCRAGGCAAPTTPAPSCILGNVSTFSCTSVTTTEAEIWCTLEPILPSNATPRNIRVTYRYDSNLGFAGGPYTPMVEVGVVTAAEVTAGLANAQELRFEFITPIPGLAAIVGGGAMSNISAATSTSLPSIPFPDLSVSLPGEDLNHGVNG